MKIIGVYSITNTVTGKKYIGSSVDIKRRWSDHKKILKKGNSSSYKLQNSYNKHGEGVFVYKIEEGDVPIGNLLNKEQEWCIFYNSVDNGYNIIYPTDKGCHHPKELGKGAMNYLLEKGPNNLKYMSKEEWIKRRTENPEFKVSSLKEIKEHPGKKAVYKIHPKTFEILEEFDSIIKASGNNEYISNRISCSLQLNNKECKKLSRRNGFVYIFKSEYDDIDFSKYLKFPKPIIIKNSYNIKNIDSQEVREFNTLQEIADFLQSNKTQVIRLKKGFKNSGGGKIVKVNHLKRWVFNKILI